MAFVNITSGRYAVGAPLATGLFADIVTDLNFLNGVNTSAIDAGGAPLVLNGSFESPAVAVSTTPANWTIVAGNAASAILSNADQNHGAQSIKFTRDTTAGHSGGTATSDTFFNVSGGITDGSGNQRGGLSYLVRFMIRSTRTDVSNTIVINWYAADQSALSSTTVYSETAGVITWTTQAVVVTPPVTAMFGKIVLSGGTSTTTPISTATIYMDGLSIIVRPTQIALNAYTSSNTFIVPSGVFSVMAKMYGGRFTLGNGAPGFGAYLETAFAVKPGGSITITITSNGSPNTILNNHTGITYSCGNGVTPNVNGTASSGQINLNGSTGFNQGNAAFVLLYY